MSTQLKIPLFTLAEVAAIAGLPMYDVNKALEKKTVPFETARVGSRVPQRLLRTGALVCLVLGRRGVNAFPPAVRRRLFRRVLDDHRQKQIRESEAVIIDVAGARHEVIVRLLELRRARRMVTTNPDILAGAPLFRGTRIPVYPIADMVRRGVPFEEIRSGYPALSEEQIRLAELYAKAVPRRGRPPVKPWSDTKPARRVRKAVARS